MFAWVLWICNLHLPAVRLQSRSISLSLFLSPSLSSPLDLVCHSKHMQTYILYIIRRLHSILRLSRRCTIIQKCIFTCEARNLVPRKNCIFSPSYKCGFQMWTTYIYTWVPSWSKIHNRQWVNIRVSVLARQFSRLYVWSRRLCFILLYAAYMLWCARQKHYLRCTPELL